eukprot:CAMPEP_0183729358 /NCGR_PEP_ID=MMETSP0737-20130205/30048_1 /TAXON_ID=385413 /ORGANISM="Thalassiosira miniscula, Strain CCMP1093" /LENGTH=41 /DNA_ID= /DNA_START= /DNA_END= /DNA_ORIENTATION=
MSENDEAALPQAEPMIATRTKLSSSSRSVDDYYNAAYEEGT